MATRQQKKAPARRRPAKDPADETPPAPAASWAKSAKLCRFILELGQHGNVTRALADSKLNRAYAYERRVSDGEFAASWDEAVKVGLQVLKDEAWRRAYQGVLEPKGIAGKKVMVRKYSDTLLMFLIKQHDPSYREHFDLTLGNQGGRPFMFQMMLDPSTVRAHQAKRTAA